MTQNRYIGLDLGGSFLKYALADAGGNIIHQGRKPSRADEECDAVFEVIYAAIEECLQHQEKGKVTAIGLGSPGAIDFDRGYLIGSTPNISDWKDVNISERIMNRYNIPVWVDNDANLMLVAEATFGAGKGYSNIVAITLGTGIGGGIMIDGNIYRGSYFGGSEIGHMSIDINGYPCKCGSRGCFEQYASATALLRFFHNNYVAAGKEATHLTTFDVFKQANEGVAEAVKALEEYCMYLGYGLANLYNIFNPHAFIIGGGIIDAGDDILARAEYYASQRALAAAVADVKVLAAKMGNDSGTIGAFTLAKQMYEKNNL